MSPLVFHSLCDNKGPLLVLIKTRKDILCGADSVQYLRTIVAAGQSTRSASYSHSNCSNYTSDRMIHTIFTSIVIVEYGLEIRT